MKSALQENSAAVASCDNETRLTPMRTVSELNSSCGSKTCTRTQYSSEPAFTMHLQNFTAAWISMNSNVCSLPGINKCHSCSRESYSRIKLSIEFNRCGEFSLTGTRFRSSICRRTEQPEKFPEWSVAIDSVKSRSQSSAARGCWQDLD